MFIEDLKLASDKEAYLKHRTNGRFSNFYLKAFDAIDDSNYHLNADLVDEFKSMELDDFIDLTYISMDKKSYSLTFNLSENRSVEVLLHRFYDYEYERVTAYCRVINALTESEKFYPLVIKMDKIFKTLGQLKIAKIGNNSEHQQIWSICVQFIMSECESLFDMQEGMYVSKPTNSRNRTSGVASLTRGHFKVVRYGPGRRYARTKWVHPYWKGVSNET